jgi:hypothetical protein
VQESALSIACPSSIDSETTEINSRSISLGCRLILVVVPVASSDHNLELVAELAIVGGVSGRYRSSPEATFDLGRALRVTAHITTGICAWVALEVDVETLAALYGRAFVRAKLRVIRL